MHVLSLIHVALAQGKVVTAPRVTGFGSANAIVGQMCNAASWIFAAAIILSIVAALLAAIKYIGSSGDPAKVKEATHRLIFAAVGVAVALVAFFLPGIVASLLSTSVGDACTAF